MKGSGGGVCVCVRLKKILKLLHKGIFFAEHLKSCSKQRMWESFERKSQKNPFKWKV